MNSVIKPSIAFRTLGRDEQKVTKYVDMLDGPSFLQKPIGVLTLKDRKGETLKMHYETERLNHT